MHRLILTAVGEAGLISHANSLLLIAGVTGGTRGATGFVCAEQELSRGASVITAAFVHYAAAADNAMACLSGGASGIAFLIDFFLSSIAFFQFNKCFVWHIGFKKSIADAAVGCRLLFN